jgi:hypothetical protein
MPKSRCSGPAACKLVSSVPDAEVKSSSVWLGERSARMSSVSRGRVGEREEREGDREPSRGVNLEVVGERRKGFELL